MLTNTLPDQVDGTIVNRRYFPGSPSRPRPTSASAVAATADGRSLAGHAGAPLADHRRLRRSTTSTSPANLFYRQTARGAHLRHHRPAAAQSTNPSG